MFDLGEIWVVVHSDVVPLPRLHRLFPHAVVTVPRVLAIVLKDAAAVVPSLAASHLMFAFLKLTSAT